jgi:hypothetical protein
MAGAPIELCICDESYSLTSPHPALCPTGGIGARLRAVLPDLPPLRKGGQGGFLEPTRGKSPLIPLFQRGERHRIRPLDAYPGAYTPTGGEDTGEGAYTCNRSITYAVLTNHAALDSTVDCPNIKPGGHHGNG